MSIKKDRSAAADNRLPRPRLFRCVFSDFTRVGELITPGNKKVLPPRVSPRTGGNISEKRTLTIPFSVCSRIFGIDKRQRGKTACNHNGISGKGRYTAAVRYR